MRIIYNDDRGDDDDDDDDDCDVDEEVGDGSR